MGTAEIAVGAGDRRIARPARMALAVGIIALVVKRLALAAGLPASAWFFPIVALLGWGAYLSPPVAAALFNMGMPLFGLESRGVPILTLLLIVTVLSVLVSRTARAQLQELMSIQRLSLYSLVGLVLVLLLGSWQGFLNTSTAVVQHNVNILRYWLGFLLIGLVCCLTFKEFRIFLAAISIFYVAVLLYLPLEAYGGLIQDAIFEATIFDVGVRYGTMNPNTLAQVSALSGVVAVSFAATARGFKRLCFGTIVLTSLTLGLLSGAKQGVVAWLFGVAMVILFLSRKRVRYLAVFAGAALLLALSLAFVAERFGPPALLARYKELLITPDAWESPSYVERAEFFRDSLQKFASSPVIGNGFGVGAEEVHEVDPESGSRTVYLVGSHNLLIDLLRETGLLGCTLFVLSVGGVVVAFFRRLRATEVAKEAARTRAVAMGALTVTVVTMMISGGMETAFLPMLLGAMAGAARSTGGAR